MIVIFDARPVGSSLWLDVWKAVQILYPTASMAANVGVVPRLDASLALLSKFEGIQPTLHDWYEQSELYQYVVGKQLIKGKVSLHWDCWGPCGSKLAVLIVLCSLLSFSYRFGMVGQ